MLIFIGIIARLPSTVIAYVQQAAEQARGGNAALWWILPFIVLGVAALVVIIVRVDLGERRIPVQYAKRISGRKVYGGQSTYIPMKPNGAGVLPLIFAMSFLAFPNIIIKMFWPHVVWYDNWLGAGTALRRTERSTGAVLRPISTLPYPLIRRIRPTTYRSTADLSRAYVRASRPAII